ncbi:MAG: pilus assembly protein PilB, partial [Gemmatimonadales bacterium]|nr:pilus assembly protein PilB [Gemmatimonadales bacterium]
MAQDTETRHKLLGRVLKDMGLVSEGQIQEGLAMQKESGGAIGEILVRRKYVSREALTLALATQAGMEVVELEGMEIPEDVLEHISPSIAQVYRVVPVRYRNGVLTVALANPTHLKTLDDLRFLINCEV